MSTPLLAIMAITYSSSLYFLIKVMRNPIGKYSKMAAVFLLLLPFIGPFMYLFAFEQPPLNRYKHRRHTIGSIGNYNNEYDVDVEQTKQSIANLEKKIAEKEKRQPKP